MLRTAIAIIAAALFAPTAVAQEFAVSPDGKHLAIFRPVPETPRTVHIDILDTACLAAGKSRNDCIAAAGPDARQSDRKPFQWSSDSRSLFATIRRRLIDLDDPSPAPRFHTSRDNVEPRTFEAGNDAFILQLDSNDPHSPFRPTDLEDPWYSVINGRAELIGRASDMEGQVRNLTGQSVRIPPRVGAPSFAPMPAKWSVVAPLRGDHFWFWSSSMGEHGLLTEFAPNAAIELPLPATQGASVLLIDDAASEPVALFDAFSVHPLARTGASLDWLVAAIAKLRVQDPWLELEAISVSVPARTAVVRARHGRICSEDRLITEHAVTLISPPCTPTPAMPGCAVQHVELPGKFPLVARLYRSNAPRKEGRRLLIQLHGGPTDNSYQSPPLNETFFDPSLDVLAVEYRGSSGLGWAYLDALKPPLGDMAAADLRTAIDWARAQPDYRDGLVGMWGDSWGGLAGHAILSRDAAGLDFVITDSGFVDYGPEKTDALCKQASLAHDLFDFVIDADGVCHPSSSGVFGRKVTAKIPVLLLTGRRDDFTTPDKITQLWADEARHNGACLSAASSAEGEHTIYNWPEESKTKLVILLRTWLSDIEANRPRRCGQTLELP